MKILEIDLIANQTKLLAVSGRYFRCLSADSPFNLSISNLGINSKFLAGLGVKFEESFDNIELLSETTQSISIITHNGEISDSRLAGEIDLSGALQMLQSAAVSNGFGAVSVGTSATLVKEANTSRRSIIVQAVGGDIYIGSTASVTILNGIHVTQGQSYTVENALAVYAIGVAAGIDVRYSEEID